MKQRPRLFERLKAGLEAGIEHQQGKRKLRVTMVDVLVPPAPAKYTPADVQRIREGVNMSQAAFAKLLCVSPRTVQGWEHGLRRPSQAAARLLQFVDHPELLHSALDKRKLAKHG